MTEPVIYHNPACGTSRDTLALMREQGLAPRVVEYLKTGWTRPQLEGLLQQMNLTARDILRVRGTEAEPLGLTDHDVTQDRLLDAMVADPALVERPIVVTARGAALCRPKDRVLELI